MLEDPEIKKKIWIETLVNAKMFNGTPNPKAVIGKLLGKNAELRSHAKDLGSVVAGITKEISSMTMDEIEEELQKIAPDAVKKEKIEKKKKADERIAQKKELEELEGVEKGNFVVRYAPDPSKYPHIGQGMNFLINRMYAEKYNGKVVLRFDDTNPTIVKSKYFDAIKDGLRWLGCEWDTEVRASQFLEEFYKVAKEWIQKGWMYVCLCAGETLSKNREDGIACEHRKNTEEQSLSLFDKMLNNEFKPGEATVRLTGDMNSDNNVMRDPIMFRVVTDTHEMLDKFYPVFPTYDFESAYLDWKMGITHIIRSGEFGTMRQELQSFIIGKLGGKIPHFKSFGRFNIQGCPTKGRVIRELVQSEVVTGWDDIRLITLAGLRNRGVHPYTPRLLIQEAGLTPKSTNIAWSTFEKKSKELLEPNARRLFFVEEPIKISISGAEPKTISIPYHPDNEKFGNRDISVGNVVYISSEDAKELKTGMIFRLKDLYNVKVTYKAKSMKVEFAGNGIESKMMKIQWVPEDGINGTLVVPDLLEPKKNEINENSLSEITGLFEANVSQIQSDEVVQLERVGYAKITKNTEKISGHIVHR